MVLVTANEATADQRTVAFHLVGTDGITPATLEADGQPQISVNFGAWTNTGIGTLTAIGNGRYKAVLTQAIVLTAGTRIETRYKSATTAECPGDSVQVVGFDWTAANLAGWDGASEGAITRDQALRAACRGNAANVEIEGDQRRIKTIAGTANSIVATVGPDGREVTFRDLT